MGHIDPPSSYGLRKGKMLTTNYYFDRFTPNEALAKWGSLTRESVFRKETFLRTPCDVPKLFDIYFLIPAKAGIKKIENGS